MSKDSYNFLDQFLQDMTKNHVRCLTDFDASERLQALQADDEYMHEVRDMHLIDEDGNLTGIGDLIVLEVENMLPR